MSKRKPARTRRIARRDLLRTGLAGGVTSIMIGAGSPAAPGGPTDAVRPAPAAVEPAPGGAGDVIRRENAKPGDRDWQLSCYRYDKGGYRSPWVEGYCSRTSVRAGESLDLMLSADPPADVVVEIYRMGFYGGAGARKLATIGPLKVHKQPDPEIGPQRLRECRWEPTCSLKIPADWVSGVYLGKLTRAEGRAGDKVVRAYQSYVIFIVRDDRKADFLFQCSDNTWQAYNRWPDSYSLYLYGTPGKPLRPGVRVSFDRPYGKYTQIFDNPLSLGSGEFLLWEHPLCYWMEERGYDVSYISNVDTHADPAGLLRARAFLSVGHDEYWSLEMFRNVAAARDAGVNLAFLSGNAVCFVTPYSAGANGTPHRIITRAGRFGGLTEAEKAYMDPFPTEGPNEATLIGARTVTPFNGSGDWIVVDAGHWLFDGTGMKNGDRIPGLVGWEFHGDPAKIPGLRVVAEGTTYNGADRAAHWTATIYPGPKGNHVFNASTIFWTEGLSAPPGHMPPMSHWGRPHGPDERVRRITANLFERFRA